jgi:hypothetical protein
MSPGEGVRKELGTPGPAQEVNRYPKIMPKTKGS